MATNFAELLAVLTRHGVAFVVVGSVAAALRGTVYRTDDLDIVPDLTAGNLERLLGALTELDARYLDAAGRILRPDPQRLRENRLNLLVTSLGRLDVLRTVGPERDYAALLPDSLPVELGHFAVRVLSLEALIEAKEHAGRDKDRLHLLLLREALRLRRLKEEP
jgi:hypothetical protein